MNPMIQALYSALRRDIKLGSSSDEIAVQLKGLTRTESPVFTSVQNSRTPGETLRFLTLHNYQERSVKRRSEQPFELRYAAFGESSLVMCGHGYAWHCEQSLPQQGSPNALSLAIEFDKNPIALATLVFDSAGAGLSAYQKFPQQVAALRAQFGENLCELTSFAISKTRKSRRALAGLLHMLTLYARQARQMQGVFVQTRQRHAAVYEDLLGFTRLSASCGVVLLFMPMDEMRSRIRQFGGRPDSVLDNAGLYKFFFNVSDEPGLQYRLLAHLAASGASES